MAVTIGEVLLLRECLKAHLKGLKGKVPALSVRNLGTGQKIALSHFWAPVGYAKILVLSPGSEKLTTCSSKGAASQPIP